MQIANRLTTAV